MLFVAYTPLPSPSPPSFPHTHPQLIPLLSGDAFGSFPAYVPLDALRCPSCCRLSAPAGGLRAMGVECGEFCFIFGSYTKFGATFSGVPSGNLRPQASQGLPRTSSSSWISVIIIIIIMGFSVFCIALEPDGVPLLTCSACSDCHPTLAQLLPLPKVSHVNLKVVVHGAAGRLSQSLSLSLNRFAGNVSFGVGDFIGAMTVA